MIDGYYLATNKSTCTDEVVYVIDCKCRSMSAGVLMLFTELSEWKDFIGPITYDLFKRLIQDIKTLRDNGDFSNGNTHPDDPSGPDEGEYMISGFVDELIKRITPTNDS